VSEGVFKDYDCRTCSPEERRKRGCKEEATDRKYWYKLGDDGEWIKRCPYALITKRHLLIVQLTSLVEIGAWPDPGGALDQANTFYRAACIVSAAKNERDKNAR